MLDAQRFRFEESAIWWTFDIKIAARPQRTSVIYENRIFMVHEFGNIRRSVILSVRIASMFVRCVATSDVIAEHLVSSRKIVLNPSRNLLPSSPLKS